MAQTANLNLNMKEYDGLFLGADRRFLPISDGPFLQKILFNGSYVRIKSITPVLMAKTEVHNYETMTRNRWFSDATQNLSGTSKCDKWMGIKINIFDDC